MSVFPLAHPSIQFHHFTPLNHHTTSAHCYPTCPSFTLISPLQFIVLYQPITISLAHPISSLQFITLYQPIAIPLAHPPIRYHHFDSSHYISLSLPHLPILQSNSSLQFISPSLSHLPILQSDIITLIHCTISAHCTMQYIPWKIFIVQTEYCVDVVII